MGEEKDMKEVNDWPQSRRYEIPFGVETNIQQNKN
jgi:hypothetical protein